MPSDNTKWLAERGWGVICCWLAAPPDTAGASALSAAAWNRRADAFDAKGLADQLAAARVPYLMITLGQNSGHFLSPNATYDRYVGIQPSLCSRRDIVADLYDCLHPKGIELLVYVSSNAPAANPVAMERLGWEWGYEPGVPTCRARRTGKRLAAFQRKWEEIIREWSTRWGRKIPAWWVDGCYFADEMYRHRDAPNFRSFAAALRAGNPDALVAFNPGVNTPVICHTEEEDYTAGEISIALPECPGPWVERSKQGERTIYHYHLPGPWAKRNGHKARYHVMSYLGETWCTGKPRFPDEMVVGYTKHVMSKGGVITWDVPIERSGLISEHFVKQLTALGRSAGAKQETKNHEF